MNKPLDPHFYARHLTRLCQALKETSMVLARQQVSEDVAAKIVEQRYAIEALAMDWLPLCDITPDLRHDICTSGSHALLMCTPLPVERTTVRDTEGLLDFCRFVGVDYFRLWQKHQYIEGNVSAQIIQLADKDPQWLEVLDEMSASPIFRGSLAYVFGWTTTLGIGLQTTFATYPTIVPRLLSMAISKDPNLGEQLLDRALRDGRNYDVSLPLLWACGVKRNTEDDRILAAVETGKTKHDRMRILSPCSATLALAARPLGTLSDPAAA